MTVFTSSQSVPSTTTSSLPKPLSAANVSALWPFALLFLYFQSSDPFKNANLSCNGFVSDVARS